MKVLWMLLALTAVASASPPPPQPPFERDCAGPMGWDKLAACTARWEKGAKVSELSPDVKVVHTVESRHYVLVRTGAVWRVAYQQGDENYELVGQSTLKVGKAAAVRIDLSHHVVLGNDGVFLERVTLVCREGPEQCQGLVTACTVTMRGRAAETFRGELKIEDEGVSVSGDRSHAGTYCAGR